MLLFRIQLIQYPDEIQHEEEEDVAISMKTIFIVQIF